MRALQVTAYGGPNALAVSDVPDRRPGDAVKNMPLTPGASPHNGYCDACFTGKYPIECH